MAKQPGGETWTRDPFKAWAFDRRQESQDQMMKHLHRKIEMSLWFKREIGDPVYTTGDGMIEWMKSEETLGPVTLTEQIFIQAPGGDHANLIYHFSSVGERYYTTKEVWGMQRDFGPENYGGYKGPDE